MGYYFSWEEDEANKCGRQDERNGRSDYTHSKYAYDGVDRAYWDGREEEQREEKRREEERREEEERQEREEHDRYERRRHEEMARDLDDALEQQRQQDELREYENDYINNAEEELFNEVMTRITETPSTEQDLFNQILEDERGNQET
jgi:hypothetical protein